MDSVELAANYAAELMRDGYEPRTAILTAARRYMVHYSAVAQAAGKRGGARTGAQRKRTSEADAFDFLKKK